MTIGYVARRLVEAYGRDAARDRCHQRSRVRETESHAADLAWVMSNGKSGSRDVVVQLRYKQHFWRSVARACTRVPVPARRGATP